VWISFAWDWIEEVDWGEGEDEGEGDGGIFAVVVGLSWVWGSVVVEKMLGFDDYRGRIMTAY
jgi:hypothetical protein